MGSDRLQWEASEFEPFFSAVSRRVVGAATLYCGDPAVAEELAQEALARACRDWHSVRALASPEGWTITVAMNLARSRFRRLRVQRRHDRASAGRSGLEVEETDHAARLHVRQAVADLPRRQREAVVLRYYADLSIADTAAAMGCAEGTVRALTAQGVAALRAALSDEEER